MTPLSQFIAAQKERDKLLKKEKRRAYVRRKKEFIDESNRRSRQKNRVLNQTS